jgi:hypothetical protein
MGTMDLGSWFTQSSLSIYGDDHCLGFVSQEHGYHVKDPLRCRTLGAEQATLISTVMKCSRRTKHTILTERHHDLTEVLGPREEVKPLLMPSCIAPRMLARYNKVWLHDAA